MTSIPITKPVFGPEERLAVQQPLETGWVVQGPRVREFEATFARFSGARHAVATTSCTTALHVLVAALGLKPGDEVLVPAFTWVATPNVVEYMGAKPVFVDVDARTYNLDPAALEAAVTDRTVGILPVHLFGLLADMDAVARVARERGLWVVEDAACAFGARYRGRHAGTFGDAGAFSFHPRKAITTGEGGMVTTDRKDLADLTISLRDHGATRSDLARHVGKSAFLLAEFPHVGYNYRMTDLQGALGVAQMARADWILRERDARAKRYHDLLAGFAWLETPHVPAGHTHGWQAYVCNYVPERPTLGNVDRLHERRNRMMETLEARGIATRQGTHAPPVLGYYATKYGYRPEHFPRAYLADRLTITLPLFPQMTDEEQDTVVAELQRVAKEVGS